MGQQIANTLGMGLGALSTIQAIRSGQYQNQAIQRAAALANPEVRAGLVNSPFTAGTMFLGGGPKTLAAPATSIPEQPQPLPPGVAGPPQPGNPFQVNVPQQTAWTPNLPPMSPENQLKQVQAQQGVDLSQYDPIVSRTAHDAGTPEDVGNIIQRSGPQGISNVTARTGGLGMFQLNPSQYMDLGNGQYGLVDAQGNVRKVGQQPGAAATVADQIKQTNKAQQNQGLVDKGYGAVGTGASAPPAPASVPASTATVPTSPGPRLIPLDLNDPTPIGQKLAPTSQAPQAPQQPQQAPPQGQQAQSGPIGYPSPMDLNDPNFVNSNLPTPPPVTPPVISNRSPEARQMHGPKGLNKESPLGNTLTGEQVTADGQVLKYGVPKFDPVQRAAGIMFGDSDITKRTPEERARIESFVQSVANGSKELQGLVTGLNGEESSRVASIIMAGDAFLKLHNMSKGVLDYVGGNVSIGQLRRGIAKEHSIGFGTGDPGYEQARGLIDQMRLLAFTFGGKQLSTRGGGGGSTYGLINFNDAGDSEAKRVDAIIPMMTGNSQSQFVSKGALFADALKTQIESVIGGASYGMKPELRQHLVGMYNALDAAVSPVQQPKE